MENNEDKGFQCPYCGGLDLNFRAGLPGTDPEQANADDLDEYIFTGDGELVGVQPVKPYPEGGDQPRQEDTRPLWKTLRCDGCEKTMDYDGTDAIGRAILAAGPWAEQVAAGVFVCCPACGGVDFTASTFEQKVYDLKNRKVYEGKSSGLSETEPILCANPECGYDCTAEAGAFDAVETLETESGDLDRATGGGPEEIR